MNNYNGDDPEVRKNALRRLWTNFQNDPELQRRCTDERHPQQARRAAWEALKAAGVFQDDPDGFDDVEVRMYQAPDRSTRDRLVTIAFPPDFDPESFRLGDVWLCSWNLWAISKEP